MVNIRKATVADLPALHACAKEFYSASEFLTKFNLDRFILIWDQFITAEIGVIFIAEDGPEIMGCLGGMYHQDFYGEDLIAEEFFWFVRKEARGTFGVRLYKMFETWAREKGAVSIQMVHLMDSMPEKLESFYKNLGYKPVEIRYTKPLT